MNRKFKALLSIAVCALTFVACKKDQLPSQEEAMAVKPNGSGSLIQPAPKYTLVRRGTDSLSYYDDGRLAKVIHQFGHTVYGYGGFGAIYAKTYENGMLTHEDTYQVDAATGRAYEQKSVGYTNFPNGSIVTTNVYKFEYDAQGRLSKKYNKDKPNERRVFTYTAAGNIYQIKRYTETNELFTIHEYGYYGGADNKLKLNVEYQGIDLFLNIFGKTSNSMPVQQWSKYANGTLNTNESLTYTVNGDGYVTNFIRFDLVKNKQTQSVDFKYKPIRQMN